MSVFCRCRKSCTGLLLVFPNLVDCDPGQRHDWPVLWMIERIVHILWWGGVFSNLGDGDPGHRLDCPALWMIERNIHILWLERRIL